MVMKLHDIHNDSLTPKKINIESGGALRSDAADKDSERNEPLTIHQRRSR